MLRRLRWCLWIFVGLLTFYTGISMYFMDHFFPGTTINGEDAGLLTPAQAGSLVLRQAEEYELTLQGREGETFVLKPEEMGISFCETDAVSHVKRIQSGFLWPRLFWQKDFYSVTAGTLGFEGEAFGEAIENLDCVRQGEEPENAWVYMSGDGYKIHPEDRGSRIDVQALKEQVQGAVSNFRPVLNLEESRCYVEPEITQDSKEITDLTKKLDRWLSAEVTYEFGPETEVVDCSVVSGFIRLCGFEAELNPRAVTDWVADLAAERDTCNKRRSFKSSRRGTIMVKGGNYGWQMDQETESAALLQHIEKGEVIRKEPAYLKRGNAWSSNYDIGDTYIEIDISAQHMWVYIDGSLLVDTDVVTGNMRLGRRTPEMVASIQNKSRNVVLRGPDYASPVKYWMPFYRGYGIHDSSWRRNYGGDIYLSGGSHGCVNTPFDVMKIIYENVEKGTPVILYY